MASKEERWIKNNIKAATNKPAAIPIPWPKDRICRFYADKNNNFIVEAWINYYDKISFASFLENWEKDANN